MWPLRRYMSPCGSRPRRTRRSGKTPSAPDACQRRGHDRSDRHCRLRASKACAALPSLPVGIRAELTGSYSPRPARAATALLELARRCRCRVAPHRVAERETVGRVYALAGRKRTLRRPATVGSRDRRRAGTALKRAHNSRVAQGCRMSSFAGSTAMPCSTPHMTTFRRPWGGFFRCRRRSCLSSRDAVLRKTFGTTPRALRLAPGWRARRRCWR